MNKHEERLKKQRAYRKKNEDRCTRKYEKTPNGFLMRKYRNMQSRVLGIQKKKKHLYQGLKLLDRQTFYEWAKCNKDFHSLYNNWIKSGYERKLCPTVNRINPQNGYLLTNMEWITHSENSRLGALSQSR